MVCIRSQCLCHNSSISFKCNWHTVPSSSLPLLLHLEVFFPLSHSQHNWLPLGVFVLLIKCSRQIHQTCPCPALAAYPPGTCSCPTEVIFDWTFLWGPYLKAQKQKTDYLCKSTVVPPTFILHAVSVIGLILHSPHRNINFKEQNLDLDWVLFVIRANIRCRVGTQ